MSAAKPGQLLWLKSGEYSDKSSHGFYVVLKEFDPLAKGAEYMARPGMEDWQHDFFDVYEFVPWLLAQGLLLEVQHAEWHLADYGRLSEMSFSGHIT